MEAQAAITIIVALVIAGIIHKWWTPASMKDCLHASAELVTEPSPQEAVDALLELFRGAPFRATVLQLREHFILFKRGNWADHRLEQSMDWHEAPVLTSVTCRQDRGRTVIKLVTFAAQQPDLDEELRAWFIERVAEDAGWLKQRLTSPQQRAAEPAKPKPDPLARAYAALRLQAGASWPEVQSAYREVVKQYHPDRLSGQNLPGHLVDLAVREFKLKTQAYHTLRQHLAA